VIDCCTKPPHAAKGGEPALITGFSLEFAYASEMDGECVEIGGNISVAGFYDIRVPAKSPPTPFTLRKDAKFSVAPNAYDRLAITLGPDDIPQVSLPYLYVADVELETGDEEETVQVGRFAVASPVSMVSSAVQNGRSNVINSYTPDIQGSDFYRQCVIENARRIQSATQSGVKSSPELLQLSDQYSALLTYIEESSDADQGPLASVDWNAAPLADSRCLALELDPATGPIRFADLTGDGAKDAIVTLSCGVYAGGYPEIVRVFDGASDPREPRVLCDAPLDYSTFQPDTGVTIDTVLASPRGVLLGYTGQSADGVDKRAVTEYRWDGSSLQMLD
jgi:hypothetical protein